MFETRKIEPADVLVLRQRVLRPDQTVNDCVWDGDDVASHFGGFVDGELVTIASVRQNVEQRFGQFAGSQFQMRGMATHEDHRGHGFGKVVLQACIQHCWAADADVFWCNARVTALDFYAKQGFQLLPELFHTGAGPHHVMYVNRLQ